MVKKPEQMVKELREKMRGGSGAVEITHIFKKEELKGKIRLLARLTLNPGCSIGMHEHVEEEEIFYIFKGSGVVVDDGVRYDVKAGDSILTGGGASHCIENTGNEPLEVMAVILPY